MLLHVPKKSILSLGIFVFLPVVGCFIKNPGLGTICCLMELGYIVFKARFSIVSVFSTLLNYCMIMEYLAYEKLYVYGLLNLKVVTVYYWEFVSCCFIFNILTIILISTTNFLNDEKQLYNLNFNISGSLTTILLSVAILLTLMIFPSMPGTISDSNRFSSGILPFRGWSCIPFFFLAVGVLARKHVRIVVFGISFVCAWYVLHGERVEAIGMLIFGMLWFFNTRKVTLGKKIGIFILAVFTLFFLTAIGIFRGGTHSSFSMVIRNLIVQSTACDVTHTFNCAVDLWKKNSGYSGITYISYLINCIPLLKDDYSFQKRIAGDYRTAGGGIFFAEPYANGGIMLVLLFCTLWFVFIRIITKRKILYCTLIYIELVLSIFRTAWYGLNYSIITILYFVPFVVLLNKLFLKRYQNKREMKTNIWRYERIYKEQQNTNLDLQRNK
ncbi:MAG: hypothetical protein HFH97_09160 [Lachnospiraceae bacterium]|nr:hypothetical protein [uncultured Acetatifactor sp.]MCI9572762.1 hypothetical protein [Lachnospiraceae bacterium]